MLHTLGPDMRNTSIQILQNFETPHAYTHTTPTPCNTTHTCPTYLQTPYNPYNTTAPTHLQTPYNTYKPTTYLQPLLPTPYIPTPTCLHNATDGLIYCMRTRLIV